MKCSQAAERGQRYHAEDEHDMPEDAKSRIEQHDHQSEDEAEDEPEARLGALLVLELASPFDSVLARVESNLAGNSRLGFRQQRQQIAIAVVELHRHAALVHPTRDGALAELRSDASDLRERDESAVT